jgi:alkanesulfonate monooxygenase SsuD/methylene tetrahydromethanopterin reductase-like flavin-dependent oxidoreductase (luciferase family)
VRAILPMFSHEGWEYHGKYFDFPLRNVVPKPLQKPHPPLWVACSQLETIAMAGRRGMGALGFQFVSAEAAHAWVNAYYNAYVKRRELLCDHATNPQIAVVCGFMCAETDAEAIEKAEGWTFFQFALLFYNQHGPVVPGSVNLWGEYEKWKQSPAGAKAQRGTGLIGSPATLRERLHKFRDSNVDQVILLNQAGRNSHEDICSSLDLFAREVMPEFHADEPAHQAWKQKVLAREIELDEIDTAPYQMPSNQTPSKKLVSAQH